MKISQAQLASISASYLQDYIDETRHYLSEKYPDWSASELPGGAEGFIRTGVRRAARYNLRAKREATAFLEYCVRFGTGFEKLPEHEWAARILRIRNLQGAEKLRRLLEQHPL